MLGLQELSCGACYTKSIVGGKRRFISHSRYLQAHVSLILLTNTFFLLFSLVVFLNPAFFTNPNLLKYYRFGWSNAIFIFNNALCDGLLIWRCYMVQRALFVNRPAGLHHLCWIIPLILCVSTFSTGMAVIALLSPPYMAHNPRRAAGIALIIATLFTSLTLNIFTTANIVIRLFLHRRLVASALGRDSPALVDHHLTTSGILLESAAINVPVMLVAVVWILAKRSYVAIVIRLIVPCQSIASLLVIYQVAKGRAFSAPGTRSLDTLESSFSNNG